MDGLFAFLGAFVGGVAAGLVNWFLIDKQHRNAKELQDRQFTQSERARELEQRYARGNQIAEWDRQRQERDNQREFDRQREYERAQLEAIRALELSLPSFSRAARVLFEAKQERDVLVKAGNAPPEIDPELQAYVTQFNDLRYVAL